MTNVIYSIDDLTPPRLTALLRNNDLLPYGEVLNIAVDDTHHMASLNYSIHVTYSDIVAATLLPDTFFFKVSRPERLPLTESEVAYYTKITAAMDNPPIPTCYDAQYDPATGAYHILMENMTATHKGWDFPVPPTLDEVRAMVEALADFHTFWWGSERLQGDVADWPTPEVIDRYVATCHQGLEPMAHYLGERLSAEQRRIIDKVFATHPRLMKERAAQGHALTLIHGDTHAGNFLLPKDPTTQRALLIDRQPFDWSLTCWLGVSDLAYMMVHWWWPEFRRHVERPMVEHYHRRLVANGITNYSWEQAWADYRLCAMQSFYVAIEWACEPSFTENRLIWFMELQNTLAAFNDLNCAELIGL